MRMGFAFSLSSSICKVGGAALVPHCPRTVTPPGCGDAFYFFPPLDNLERFGNRDQPCFQFLTDSETAPEGFTVTYVLE